MPMMRANIRVAEEVTGPVFIRPTNSLILLHLEGIDNLRPGVLRSFGFLRAVGTAVGI